MLRLSSNEGNSGMRTAAICVTVGLALAGCGPSLEAKFAQSVDECRTFLPPRQGNFVKRAECYSKATNLWFPHDRYRQTLAAGRLAMAQRVDRGDITVEDANFQAAKLQGDLESQALQDQVARDVWIRTMLGR